MVVMLAKWPGRCKRCGKPIVTGTPMDWVKGSGATHATPEDCENAASEAPPLRGPQPEDPEDRMNVVELLLAHPWKTATSKRYEKLPHQYTLRHQWLDDEAFLWVVSHIRNVGYEKYFIGRVWIYYDIGDMQYWDCGGELHTIEGLNRAVRK